MSPESEYKYPKPEDDKEGYEDWYDQRSIEIKCFTEDEAKKEKNEPRKEKGEGKPKKEETKTDIGKVAALNYYGGDSSKYSEFYAGERENHDSLAVFEDEKYVYMTVIDGMGGHENAEQFSKKLTEELKEKLQSEKDFNFSLEDVYAETQKEMGDFSSDKAGAVATTVMIDKETKNAEIINLGDSRGAVIGQDGSVKAASEIQTTAATYFKQRNDRDNFNAFTSEFFDFLSEVPLTNDRVKESFMSSGGTMNINPDISRVEVGENDFIILGSDGIINEALTINEVAKEVKENPDQSAAELREALYDKMRDKLDKANKDGVETITTIDENGEPMEISSLWARKADNMSLIVAKID
ncbi:MAG: PP2C family serine/threonine-protein phosphatase [Candidatus Magasanikbacteria bacterium]